MSLKIIRRGTAKINTIINIDNYRFEALCLLIHAGKYERANRGAIMLKKFGV